MNSRFLQRMQAQNDAGRFACAGLDPVEGKMPADRLWKYHLDELIDIAAPHAGAFKPNWAFYLGRAAEGGLVLLERVCKQIREASPDALIVLDMKCADIGGDQPRVHAVGVRRLRGGRDHGPLVHGVGSHAADPRTRGSRSHCSVQDV